MIHGWPGSVSEFYDIIPMLTDTRQKDFVFEIIVPSLPGFGFSEAPKKPGMGPAFIGAIFNELMIRLNHKQYYIQAGDWGSAIGYDMAVLYPEQ